MKKIQIRRNDMKNVLMVLLAVLALASCDLTAPGGDNGTPPDVDNPVDNPVVIPGPVVTKIEGRLEVREASPVASRSITVDVGDIQTSQSLYFILRNVGDAPINGVTLTSNHANVSVTPSSIPVLQTDATSSLYTLIRVDIEHGSEVGTIGFTDLITAGDFSSLVAIGGSYIETTTTEETDAEGNVTTTTVDETKTIAIDLELNAFIKVADWRVEYDYGNTGTFVPFVYSSTFNFRGGYVNPTWTQAEAFTALESNSVHKARILNTGNVPIYIKDKRNTPFLASQGTEVQPNEYFTVNVQTQTVPFTSLEGTSNLVIKTGGVIFPKFGQGDYLNFIEGSDCIVLTLLVGNNTADYIDL